MRCLKKEESMSKYKVFMTDCIFPDVDIERRILSAADAELVLASGMDTQTFIREGWDCDAVIAVYANVDATYIGTMEKCRLIIKMGIGIDNIDVDAATRKGIMVANVPDYCIGEVADHTVALFLSGVRKICALDNNVKEGRWDFNDVKPIPRLEGMVFGLFGFGNIAQCVAKRVIAFDMKVLAFDPYLPDDVFESLNVERVRAADMLFSQSDFLSLHAPLTPDTLHIIDAMSIGKMKATAYIVNTSRGPLIKEDDLVAALKSGRLAGAALDVFEKEPLRPDSELAKIPNVLLTPHAAFYSEGSGVELREKAARDVANTLAGSKPRNWLNRRAMQAT